MLRRNLGHNIRFIFLQGIVTQKLWRFNNCQSKDFKEKIGCLIIKILYDKSTKLESRIDRSTANHVFSIYIKNNFIL